MVFSSITFLYFFFPLVVVLSTLVRSFTRDKKNFVWINSLLLFFSLVFYAWGEPLYVFLMIFSIAINFKFGLEIDREENEQRKKAFMTIAVVINLALLGVFKYAGMFVDFYNAIVPFEGWILPDPQLQLPIGISFFTFQAMSYLIDVYRKETQVQTSVFRLGLYISFFPQLIAGPIVRYHDIAQQLEDREITNENRFKGLVRFATGLGKKVLIANTMAAVADDIFTMPLTEISTPLAWLGTIAYTLQIYFDFSGYSDMAIGLGRIFGFKFLENFNYPYIAKGIQDFWRRWHISLSSWFRDYLYIPLGGNKKGKYRTYINQFIVFFLCGLWHGASWTFVFWGVYHGLFLTLEKMKLNELQKSWPKFLVHIYTLVVVMIGWVFFRSESFGQSLTFIGALFGFGAEIKPIIWKYLGDPEFLLFFVFAIIGATPLLSKLFLRQKGTRSDVMKVVYTLFTAFLSVMYLSAGTYNPFIYFRF